MNGCDDALRQLNSSLRRGDYGAARMWCASNFLPFQMTIYGTGASDSNLAITADALLEAEPAGSRRLGRYNSIKDGFWYMPDTYGPWPFHPGRYYVFRHESGRWKFTGEAGYFQD